MTKTQELKEQIENSIETYFPKGDAKRGAVLLINALWNAYCEEKIKGVDPRKRKVKK